MRSTTHLGVLASLVFPYEMVRDGRLIEHKGEVMGLSTL